MLFRSQETEIDYTTFSVFRSKICVRSLKQKEEHLLSSATAVGSAVWSVREREGERERGREREEGREGGGRER